MNMTPKYVGHSIQSHTGPQLRFFHDWAAPSIYAASGRHQRVPGELDARGFSVRRSTSKSAEISFRKPQARRGRVVEEPEEARWNRVAG